MGDRHKRALRVQFDGKLKLEFHGTKITSRDRSLVLVQGCQQGTGASSADAVPADASDRDASRVATGTTAERIGAGRGQR
jgi:hypothetical protein